jgi:hypothetical protein
MIANPSALIGADIATAQAMRAKGAREGLAGSMAEGAEVVVPPRQAAEPLLRRKEGAPLHPHQPDAAWIACDGSYGITRGRWAMRVRAVVVCHGVAAPSQEGHTNGA